MINRYFTLKFLLRITEVIKNKMKNKPKNNNDGNGFNYNFE